MKAKYGILVLTVDVEPFLTFDAIRKEYFKSRGILAKFIINTKISRPSSRHEMIYLSDCDDPSGTPVMLEKFQWALGELLDDPAWSECEYFVRLNSSTFLNLGMFDHIIESLPPRRCYAGPICFHHFVGGTCIVISRDVAKYLANTRIEKEKNHNDDVAIAHLLRRRLIRMKNIPIVDFIDNKIHSLDEIADTLDSYPLIRIKNSEDRMKYDVDVWRKIAACKGLVLS